MLCDTVYEIDKGNCNRIIFYPNIRYFKKSGSLFSPLGSIAKLNEGVNKCKWFALIRKQMFALKIYAMHTVANFRTVLYCVRNNYISCQKRI